MRAFFSSFRSGAIALGLVAGMTAPSLAGPIVQPDMSNVINAGAINSGAPQIVPVRESWAGSPGVQNWRWRNRGNWRWHSGNFGNRYVSRNWNRGNWNGGWHHHRRHFRGGDAAILGLGLGLGLGGLPYYDGYDPYYDAYPPYYYQPRRIYRTERLSNAHVRWCYNRYRSYRAWDNTFQPNYGPRRQCISPYR